MSRKLSASGGFTQLMMACEEGDLHRVKAMLPSPHLNAKNQVRYIQHGYSALALAVKSGHIAIVKELISAGADINSRNNAGQSVLFIACWHNQEECAKLLLDAGADIDLPDQRGWTPLTIAVYHNYYHIVALLIQYSPNLDHIDCFGKKAIDRSKSVEISMLLQKAASERRLQSANISLHMPLARSSDGLVKRNSDRNARAGARSSSAGRPRTADSVPESRRSLTPKRSRDTTPLRDAVPVEKRRKFKEKLDEQIKVSIESLSAKMSEDWFNKLQNTLNSELHHAEQTLQREVEVLINKSSRDLFGKLRDHVFRVVDENCARKGMQIPSSHLQSADFNLNINKFRASSAINLDRSHLENMKVITSEMRPVSIDIESDADFRQIDNKLNDALGRYIQDLEDRMKEYTQNVVAKEVDARIQKTRQLITSELQESLADMASQLRGKLEIIAQARASEISEGSVEVETPKSELKQGEASYSFDTYNFKFDEHYLKTPDSSSTPKNYDLIEGLVRNSQMGSSKSHESFRSPQQPQGRKKSAKAKPASRPSPPRTKILDTLKQFLKSESNFT